MVWRLPARCPAVQGGACKSAVTSTRLVRLCFFVQGNPERVSSLTFDLFPPPSQRRQGWVPTRCRLRWETSMKPSRSWRTKLWRVSWHKTKIQAAKIRRFDQWGGEATLAVEWEKSPDTLSLEREESFSRQEVNNLLLFFYHNVGFMINIHTNNVATMLQQYCNNVVTMLQQDYNNVAMVLQQCLQPPNVSAASLYFRFYGEIFFWKEVSKVSIKVKSWGEINRFYVTTVNTAGFHKVSINRKKHLVCLKALPPSPPPLSWAVDGLSQWQEFKQQACWAALGPSCNYSLQPPTVWQQAHCAWDSASHTRHLGWEREKMKERFGILFVEKTQLVLTVKVTIKPEESC